MIILVRRNEQPEEKTMTIEEKIKSQYLVTAKEMKKIGWTVEDCEDFEILTVENKESGDLYEFKYDERDNLKADQPDWLPMDFEDYLLAIAANW